MLAPRYRACPSARRIRAARADGRSRRWTAIIARGLSALLLLGLCGGCAPLLVGGAATTGAVVAGDPRTAGTLVEDQAIEMRAAAALRADEALREQTHVSITSYNEVVLLTGQAPSRALRERTVALVREVDKVRHVYDEIAIGAPSALLSRTNDGLLTTRVKTRLITDAAINAQRIKVVTEADVVYLMGFVTRKQGALAADIASATPGVKRVVKLFEYPAGSPD